MVTVDESDDNGGMEVNDIKREDPLLPAAFWISPGGEITPVADTHIEEVARDPGRFELTMAYLLAAYAREGERPWIEGRARRRIIMELVRRGWIRIRRFPRTGSWTLNIRSLDGDVRRSIAAWAAAMLVAGVSGHDLVRCDLPGGVVECGLGDCLTCTPPGSPQASPSSPAVVPGAPGSPPPRRERRAACRGRCRRPR